MKKIALTIFLCIGLLGSLTGCKGKVRSLKLSEINQETFLLRSDGTVQSAAYEKFDKSYYREDELKEYMETIIDQYNEENDQDSVKLNRFEVDESNSKTIAKAIFTYDSVETYCALTDVKVASYTVEEAKEEGILPTSFTNAADGSKADQNEVTKNSDYNVLVIELKADVMLPDGVKYYSNAMLLSSDSVETTGDGVAVIVYK